MRSGSHFKTDLIRIFMKKITGIMKYLYYISPSKAYPNGVLVHVRYGEQRNNICYLPGFLLASYLYYYNVYNHMVDREINSYM